MMKRTGTLAFALALAATGMASAKEAKLTRYPHYHNGKVAFCYLGDIWTATEDGKNIQRLTAHKARDFYPAVLARRQVDRLLVSDRNGNLDVFVIPADGGAVKAAHDALGRRQGRWAGPPTRKSVLFASQRGEDFMPKLYTVPSTAACPATPAPTWASTAASRPTARSSPINRKGQSYWRKFYRGAYQTDVTVMDLASKTFKDMTDFDGLDSWPMWSQDGFIYFVSDRDGNGLTNIWRVPEKRRRGREGHELHRRRRPLPRHERRRQDDRLRARLRRLEARPRRARRPTPLKFDIAAETQENLTEYRDFNSRGRRLRRRPRRQADRLRDPRRDLHRADGRGRPRPDHRGRDQGPQRRVLARRQAHRVRVRQGPAARRSTPCPADGAGETKKITDHRQPEGRLLRGRPTRRSSPVVDARRQAPQGQRRRQGAEGAGRRRSTAGSTGSPGRPTASGWSTATAATPPGRATST